MTLPIGVSRGLAAGIVWGAAFDKTLRFGFPMLDVRTYPLQREGSKLTRAAVIDTDGWTVGRDRFLDFSLPAIPPEDEVDPYGYGDASGWDSADGWEDFLAFARRKNTLRFAPNLAAYVAGTASTWIACKLVEPWNTAPEGGWNTMRGLKVVLRASGDQYFEGY